jgi:HAD superfamily hydrolase (TIGR01509 family)
VKAISFDYWDTLYIGAALPERIKLRKEAVRRLLSAYGRILPEQEFADLYARSGDEADRWWREEHRGFTAADRIHWLLSRVNVQPKPDCEYLAGALEAVDNALLILPPPLIPGAYATLRALARRVPLAIISDTGFASGRAQDRLLEKDGVRVYFAATVYSMDVGHAKPRPEPFRVAAAALALAPEDIVHIGDDERTDVRGALDAGMRAVRLDVIRSGGPSAAEFVARDFEELTEYLERG